MLRWIARLSRSGAAIASGRSVAGAGGPRPVFVFCSRSYLWRPNVLRRVFRRDAAFRETILECDDELRHRLDWSLADLLNGESGPSGSELPEMYFEPALTAVQIAQVEAWRSRGVEPGAVVGLCGGEIAAAYAAGALTVREALGVSCICSRVIAEGTAAYGGMVMVNVSLEEAVELQAAVPEPIQIIVEWTPKKTMLAGDNGAVQALVALLDGRGIGYRRLPTTAAYHVPLRDMARGAFLLRSVGLRPNRPTVPIYSSMAAGPLRDARFDAQHWLEVATGPAFLVSALGGVMRDGYDAFLEIGLRYGATYPISDVAATLGRAVVVVPSLTCLAEGGVPSVLGQSVGP